MAYNKTNNDAPELIEKVVYLNRVSKTVKGGRVMKFSALVVVGDGKGTVGYGLGKAAEVSEAILKGIADAKKNMVKVSLAGTTIPHDTIGIFGAGTVLLKPAPEGTGVIAGGAVRAVMEAVGIKNIWLKSKSCSNFNSAVSDFSCAAALALAFCSCSAFRNSATAAYTVFFSACVNVSSLEILAPIS